MTSHRDRDEIDCEDETVEFRRTEPEAGTSSSSDNQSGSSQASPVQDKIYPDVKDYYRDSSAIERVYVSTTDGDDGLTGRRRKSPYRISVKEKHLYNLFKYTLLGFNGALILLIIGGVFVYFTEFRDKTLELNPVEQKNFLDDSLGGKSGPKYAWITTTLAFALLLTIPCTGFIGALKEQQCLLIVYGVIFFVEAIVCVIFRTFWFLIPAFVSLCAIGLVFLQRTERFRGDTKNSHSTFIPFRSAASIDKDGEPV